MVAALKRRRYRSVVLQAHLASPGHPQIRSIKNPAVKTYVSEVLDGWFVRRIGFAVRARIEQYTAATRGLAANSETD